MTTKKISKYRQRGKGRTVGYDSRAPNPFDELSQGRIEISKLQQENQQLQQIIIHMQRVYDEIFELEQLDFQKEKKEWVTIIEGLRQENSRENLVYKQIYNELLNEKKAWQEDEEKFLSHVLALEKQCVLDLQKQVKLLEEEKRGKVVFFVGYGSVPR